jgi:hypothetical protein
MPILVFVAPLFSYSYKLLFPHRLYFDIHANCPGGGVHLQKASGGFPNMKRNATMGAMR